MAKKSEAKCTLWSSFCDYMNGSHVCTGKGSERLGPFGLLNQTTEYRTSIKMENLGEIYFLKNKNLSQN